MAQALATLPPVQDERLLVGINTADDAGVYKLADDLALVQTVDLLTPVCEDPYAFGQVAAANSLSDVYAMGGEPLTALNVVGFPQLGKPEWLTAMLRGTQDKVGEAGALVVGGHTFNEAEIKLGLAVTGRVHPDRIITNDRVQPGDRLVLTKPLGSGLMVQAMVNDIVDAQGFAPVLDSMRCLNRAASDAMRRVGARACTDITGFGFLGHLIEMAEASRVGMKVPAAAVPFFDGVFDAAARGSVDPACAMNRSSFSRSVDADTGVDPARLELLYGSETSGGLVIAVPGDAVERLVSALAKAGVATRAVVAEAVADHPGRVHVVA